jgi:hypothetical protein
MKTEYMNPNVPPYEMLLDVSIWPH